MRTTSRSDREHVTRDNLRSFPAHFARLCVIPAAATVYIRERGFISLRRILFFRIMIELSCIIYELFFIIIPIRAASLFSYEKRARIWRNQPRRTR